MLILLDSEVSGNSDTFKIGTKFNSDTFRIDWNKKWILTLSGLIGTKNNSDTSESIRTIVDSDIFKL